MSNFVLECELCEFQTTDFDTEWCNHLFGEAHQKVTRERCGALTEAEKQRLCVVFGVRGLRRENILNYFCGRSVITDFVFWEECPDICLVEFPLYIYDIRQIAHRTKSILGYEVVLRLRDELSDVEWRAICPASSSAVVQEKQVKETKNLTPECRESVDGGSVAVQQSVGKEAKNEEPSLELPISLGRHETSRAQTCSLPQSSKVHQDIAIAVAPLMKPHNRPKVTQTGKGLRIPLRPKRNPDHSLSLNPSKQFFASVDTVKNPDIRREVSTNTLDYWLQLIHEFNLVVWENFFGFELYELTGDDCNKIRSPKRSLQRNGPVIRGTLTVVEKVYRWAVDMESNNAMGTYKASYKDRLRKGVVPVKPLRCFDEHARSLYKKNSAFLSFDLQIAAPLPGSNPRNPIYGELQFQNVVFSPDANSYMFKQIIAMYNNLWKEFGVLKLRNS